ncbi:Na(+)/H(+) antiporter subunit B [Arthrobacter bambusae]|uniref:Na(+)/H(+) antiporter subunit B n=1 Tax=Arthrobacter bambusae TaxID=1338426 RepID=UPI0027835BF0|nr:DUF4040 domain-containing protein [Arthrobacter bambusae]MDQ0028425.1 putative MnhB-related membrane protein [Arthrobacter bambusae]MDQ0096780.1 putative MnhB-related membrane protein [Arthrobacter bambusae]
MNDGVLSNVLIVVSLTLVLVGAAAVVLTRHPSKQAVVLSCYGLLLTILFVAFQAPDVALSQVAIGTAVVPLIVVLSIRKISLIRAEHTRATDQKEGK